MGCKPVLISDIASINARQYSNKEQWPIIRYLDTGNVTKGKIGAPQVLDTSADKVPSRARRKVKNASIVFSMVRPNQEHHALLDYPPDDMLVSTGFSVIDADKSKVVPDYLYYALTTKEATEHFQALAEQSVSTYPTLGIDDLASFEVELPNIDVQRRVSFFLKALDKKIASNEQINDYLRELASRLFDQLVERCVDSTMLGTYIDISSGKRPPVKSPHLTDECFIPLYGASSQMGYTSEHLTDEKLLIIGRVGTHGVVQRVNSKAWPSDNTLVIRPSHYEIAFQLLQRIDYASLNRGSTQPLITQADLKACEVPLIDSKSLGLYESQTGELMALYDHNFRESTVLAQLRDTLLPGLMSGEIDASQVVI